MLQKLFRICSLILTYIAFFSAQKSICSEQNPKLLEESSGEYFHIVSQEDLLLDDEGIQVNLNGTLYLASSLKRIGNQWLVNFDPRYQCVWGHPLCVGEHGCGQCHTRICPLYQPRTSHCR